MKAVTKKNRITDLSKIKRAFMKTSGMKLNWKILLLAATYFMLILIMFILPGYSVQEYSIIKNTLSDLGAQSTHNSWIINSMLLLLAASTVYAGWGCYKGYIPHRILLLLFAISLALAAYFHHAPVNTGISYNLAEDGWHKYFLGTAGLSFSLLSFASGFIPTKQQTRPFSIIAGLSVILFSVLMSEAGRFSGIWQRLIFLISIGWMLYYFSKKDPLEKMVLNNN
jgi:hypothetical membrane protein